MSLIDSCLSQAEARSFIEASLANFEGMGTEFGLLRSEEEVPNLIYGIHPDFAGNGYATEAAGKVLTYAFDSLALSNVKGDVDEPNAESVRVLEKLKMKRVNRGVSGGRPLLYFERC